MICFTTLADGTGARPRSRKLPNTPTAGEFSHRGKAHQSGPPDCTTLMSFVESQPLQVIPPTKETHYSNVGFCALSEVIRETSGVSYLDYMTANVFAPLGMPDTTLGATPEQSRQLDRESVYYDINTPGDTLDAPEPSLFPPYGVVPAPYSGIGSLKRKRVPAGSYRPRLIWRASPGRSRAATPRTCLGRARLSPSFALALLRCRFADGRKNTIAIPRCCQPTNVRLLSPRMPPAIVAHRKGFPPRMRDRICRTEAVGMWLCRTFPKHRLLLTTTSNS